MHDAEVGIHRLEVFGIGVRDVMRHRTDHHLRSDNDRFLPVQHMGKVDSRQHSRRSTFHITFHTGQLSRKEQIIPALCLICFLQAVRTVDVVVWEQKTEEEKSPLLIIECKAEEVPLDNKVFKQADNYSAALGTEYFMITNGLDTFSYRYDKNTDQVKTIKSLPEYKELLIGKYEDIKIEASPKPIPFDKLGKALDYLFEDYDAGYVTSISSSTPRPLALAMLNLEDCLLRCDSVIQPGDYGIFRLLKDYGVRLLSYGNASGGRFFGPYRSFLVDINGNAEFFSIGLSTYHTTARENKGLPAKTCICVAHDDEKTAHHSLQLVVEDNLVLSEDTVKFYHSGRIAVGRSGSGKVSELRDLVSKRYPSIIDGERYYLGELDNNHSFKINEPEIVNLITNLISYAIIRDEYREIVKKR